MYAFGWELARAWRLDAATAVAELDATDYRDLKLVGAVPMSPVTTAVIFAASAAG